MISHGKDIKIFTGNANPALAKEICQIIGTKLGDAEVTHFADGEASVSLYETVRGRATTMRRHGGHFCGRTATTSPLL